ncbi:probable pyridoxal 5'-phosphate synthase subunit PDX2 isoform X2 [Hevea brasiliensis]|uniref:probable pyridoxal 5'-phosphate synthase subunit PDX2 isoform X2 n=1 Tax=Hevea brasiliensis TaxID=3981 RepID=UPI0025D103B8|nr:probable pyridoxal 5'-phosphate synthase subunit PDX2 isoform X2 [Hevea brasiliensis]
MSVLLLFLVAKALLWLSSPSTITCSLRCASLLRRVNLFGAHVQVSSSWQTRLLKTGGQELIGGIDCTVHRNYFGSQIQSFEAELSVPELVSKEGGPETFRGVFIRAPAVLEVGPGVEVLAEYPVSSTSVLYSSSAVQIQEENALPEKKVIVAVKQGNLLGTAFHPELTSDTRWHSYFMKMGSEAQEESPSSIVPVGGVDPSFNEKARIDLPIYQ